MPPIQMTALRLGTARFATRTLPPAFVAATPAASATTAAVLATPSIRAPLATRLAATPRIETLKTIDPRFALRLANISIFFRGVERATLSGPLALTDAITEDTVYEDAKDSSKHYFMMRYAICVEHTVNDGDRFAVKLGKTSLSVNLIKAPPDAIVRANPGAQEVPHELALLIRFKQRVNGQPSAISEVPFTTTTPDQNAVGGTIELDLAKRNELYEAMTDPELACVLIVRRKARIALPVPRAAGSTGPVLYRQTDRVLDQEIPFFFNPTLNGNVFEGAGTVAPGGDRGMHRWSIPWNGETHIYYQHATALNVFYYLPDTFKIARRPAAPHEPIMSVRFDSADGTKEQIRATLTYCAVPFINRDRLTSVLPALKAKVPAELLAAGSGIEMEPLLPDPAKTKLRLSYPGADLSGGPFALRPQAQVDLRSGILDSLTTTLEQFRALFDAMFSTGQLLLSGTVEFDMGGTGEQIPFQLRLQKLSEPFAAWTQAVDGSDLLIDITNQIESIVRVNRLDAILRGDADLMVSPAQPAAGAYPVDIEPTKAFSFRVPGAAAMTLEAPDFSDVECVPNKDSVLQLILDPSTTPSYSRQITVKTFPHFFREQPDDPKKQIISILVEFQGGPSVELGPDQLSKPANLSVPVVQFITGKQESLQYKFKRTFVRIAGATADTDWRSGESETLFVLMDDGG